MMARDTFSSLKIRKRPWYLWIWRAVWIIWLVFWVEVTIGSWKEMEYKAFGISLAIFLVSLLLGLLFWLWGYQKLKKVSGKKPERE